MKNKIILFFIGVVFTLSSAVSLAAPDPNFHIYLCFGQSNMEGQGRIESQDLVVSDRFQMMSTQSCGSRELYKWYTAVPPLAGCYKQLGPADYFGRTMLENLSPEIKVGVVVVAVGGCDIKLFDKDNYLSYSYNVEDYMKEIIRAYGGNPYGRFIDCAKKAQEAGVIKGILLHQGETNTGDYSWPSKVKGVYENILNDLNLDGKDVPLLVGEVVRTEQGGSCGRHNDVIAKVPSTIPNSYVISAEGLGHQGDFVHFSAESYRKLGARYAEQMLKLLNNEVEIPDAECDKYDSDLKKEAECADYNGTLLALSDQSGSGVVNLSEEDGYVNFTFNVEQDAKCKVYVGYNTIYGYKQIMCNVNGVPKTMDFDYDSEADGKDGMKEMFVGSYSFAKGDNLVKVAPVWTWAPIDYVRIELDTDAPSQEPGVSDVEGFHVDGNKLLDVCDNEFVMRGVNMAYTWYKGSAYDQLKAIRNHGANAVRIVLTDGKDYGTPADDASAVKRLIDACRELGMVAILEVHDETGSDNISDLEDAARYFVNIADVLKGTEASVIINIANEWHNSSSAANWRDGYVRTIPMIRKAGLRHCIMVDAGGYGQNAATIHSYGKDVLAADPENNVIFSIHMYGTAGNSNRITSNIDGVINQGLALCIGEFGWYHSDGDVDEAKILSYCNEKNVGWLAWSWYGNGSPVQYLDLVKDVSANSILATQSTAGRSCEWGKIITDAWKSEAKDASMEECEATDYNNVTMTNENSTIYFAQTENTLHVNSKKEGTLRIIDINGTTIDIIKITDNRSTVNLSNLQEGVYIAIFDKLTLKIIK
jgi:hypothetical protein